MKVRLSCVGGEQWEVEAVVAEHLCYHYSLSRPNTLLVTHIPTGKFLPGTETTNPAEAAFMLAHLSAYPGWDAPEEALWEQRLALQKRIERARTLFSRRFSVKYR